VAALASACDRATVVTYMGYVKLSLKLPKAQVFELAGDEKVVVL
jgi:hypothetical protein